MKKVLLTLMPVFWPKMPPLGIACLQSIAHAHGVCVDLLDLNNAFYNFVSPDLKKNWLLSCNRYLEENIFGLIKRDHAKVYKSFLEKMLSYDVVGFSCFKSNFMATCEIARSLKEAKPCIKVVFGGPEMTRQYFKSPSYLRDGFGGLSDFCVAGEGERPFVSFLKDSGLSRRFAAFSELDDLGRAPFPKYTGLDLAAYPRKKSISVLSSRGCIRVCRFCSERLLYKKFKIRCLGRIMEELAFHKSAGIDFFVFHDSMMNADIKHLDALCEAICVEFGSLFWEAQMGIDARMPDVLFKKIKRSGCYNLFVGLESGCDRTLKNMRKGFSADGALRFFKKLNKNGVSFGVSIIVGFPGETEADFYESLDFIVRHKSLIPKIEQVNPFVRYDGIDMPGGLKYIEGGESLRRYKIFVDTVKQEGIRHTNAFLGNLIEKDDKI